MGGGPLVPLHLYILILFSQKKVLIFHLTFLIHLKFIFLKNFVEFCIRKVYCYGFLLIDLKRVEFNSKEVTVLQLNSTIELNSILDFLVYTGKLGSLGVVFSQYVYVIFFFKE